ncbi:MAG: ChaN family lipoprotein [Halorhodospira sp.]
MPYSLHSRLGGAALAAGLLLAAGAAAAGSCGEPGQWLDPASGERLETRQVLDALAGTDFILLGEEHTRADHHRWQLHTLAGLQGRGELAAVGLEMLPRGKQPALEAWRAGELDREAFLAESKWQRVWGHEAELYTPLLEFIRIQRVPARALNVARDTVRAVRREGWAALDAEQREGVGQPAEASEAYRERLRQTLAEHPGMSADGGDALAGFIAAQTFWDRAMAEALADAHERHGGPVVGIVGRGHVAHGHGIPHQLADLGYQEVQVLLPVDADEACPDPGTADYLFALEAPAAAAGPEPPRLGIAMTLEDEGRVVIQEVLADTPAAAAGLEAGDRIVEAAGQVVSRPAAMQRIVARQPPGTWLPLTVARDGERREVVVRFPPE